MTIQEKISFLENDFPKFLQTLDGNAKGKWGVLNAQQMVEHISDSLREANGKRDTKQLITPVDLLPRYYDFMMSDKPFKENTKNIQMPESPIPVRNESIDKAIEEMILEWNDFKIAFENEPEKKITNAIFGHLNYYEWLHLLHKHTKHHAKQFGWEV